MYQLKFLGKAQKDLARIPLPQQKIIKEKVVILAKNPEVLKNNINKLTNTNNDYYRLRVGSYRVVFKKEDKGLLILVIRIGHRKEIYLSLK